MPGDSIICTVISETLQWLKCQTAAQLDTENYTWVAKPPGLRCETPPTAANYSTVVWGQAFTGDRFVYRHAAERLRLYSPTSAGDGMTLRAAFTLFERNEGGSIETAADAYLATIPPIAGGTDKLGQIDYLYEFQVVWPVYSFFTGLGSAALAHSGQPATICATRLGADDVPDETPDDESFAAASVKWLDLNVSGRTWWGRHLVQPRELHVFSAGGSSTWFALPAMPQQYTDQQHGQANPTIKTQLLTAWPELNA